MANRDVNRRTNIKKDILGKKEMPRKVRDSVLNFSSFFSIDVLIS